MYQYYLSLYFHHTNLFLSLLNYAILDLIYLSQSHGYRGGCLLKIFVISDVHGYFLQMITALNEAGFNPNNEDHWLFVLGDIIDRGREPQQIIDYLISLPRKVLIRGNHEDLFIDACQRGYCMMHDIHNGTLQTIEDLSGTTLITGREQNAFSEAYSKMKPILNAMVNYIETDNYVFVHSWLPTMHVGGNQVIHPNWRTADEKLWNRARWVNPFEAAHNSTLSDKTIVFGHWHCSLGWARKYGLSEFGSDARFDIYAGDNFIAIDACTARTHRVNCLVLEDDFSFSLGRTD